MSLGENNKTICFVAEDTFFSPNKKIVKQIQKLFLTSYIIGMQILVVTEVQEATQSFLHKRNIERYVTQYYPYQAIEKRLFTPGYVVSQSKQLFKYARHGGILANTSTNAFEIRSPQGDLLPIDVKF